MLNPGDPDGPGWRAAAARAAAWLRASLAHAGFAGLILCGTLALTPDRAHAQTAPAAPGVPTGAAAPAAWLGLPQRARDLAVSTTGEVFALDAEGAPWRLPAPAVAERRLAAWVLLPGRFAQLRATLDGRLWGLTDAGELMVRDGETWLAAGQGIVDVAASPDGQVLVLRTDGRIVELEGRREWPLPAGSAAVLRLHMDEHGQPWALLADGRLLRRSSAGWQPLRGLAEPLRDLSIGIDGSTVAVSASGTLVQRQRATGDWVPHPLAATAPAGLQRARLDQRGQLWAVGPSAQVLAAPGAVGQAASLVRVPAVFTRLLAWRPVGGRASAVALGPDGSAFSLATDGAVWRWQGADRWALVGGRFRALAAGSDGAAWGLTEAGEVQVLVQGFWRPLPGRARLIAAGPRNMLWAVSAEQQLQRWDAARQSWQPGPVLPGEVRALAVGEDQQLWVVDAEGGVRWLSPSQDWTPVPGLQAASLGVGPLGTVYAAAVADQALYWLDRSDLQWKPATGTASAIAVGPQGAPWVVTPQGQLLASERFLRDQAQREAAEAAARAPPPVLTIVAGPLPTLRKALNFQTLPRQAVPLREVAIGANGEVFALATEGALMCFDNAERRFQLASPGPARRLAVSPQGMPWLVSRSGLVSRFDKGVWQAVPEFIASDLSVASDGQVWALDGAGQLWRHAGADNRFVPVPWRGADATFKAVQLAAAPGQVQWVVTDRQQLLKCVAGQCSTQLQGVLDVAVAPDGTPFVLDLLGNLRRFSGVAGGFEKQNGSGRSLAVGPQGLPWLVDADGLVSVAGLFFPNSRRTNTPNCAQRFSQALSLPELANPQLQARDVSAAVAAGGTLDLLPAITRAGRAASPTDLGLRLIGASTGLSLRQSVVTVAPGLPAGTRLSATYSACPLDQSGGCVSARLLLTVAAPATVPGAPAAPTAVAGNAQATVSFVPPTSNGGSAITAFTVVASPGGATASGTTSPLVVSGLANGTRYTFTVRAANAQGSGPASPASNAVIPAAVPGAPGTPTAAAGNGQATVSFTPPAATGGSAITAYTVVASPGGATVSGAASPLVVAGLTNGTTYTFTVSAANALGSGPASPASNAVIPAAVPGAPAAPTAVAGNGQATVSFTPPSVTGGSAITAYTVVASPGGATASGAASPLVVTGLTNGTPYTFTVSAANALGNGPASPASSAVTPATVPGVPAAPTAVAGNTQATVSFTPPAANGGSAITAYTVVASPGGATVIGAASPLLVTGLTNGTAYTFTVSATNALGAGAASPASIAVTPAAVPGAPAAPTAVAGNGQATVSFAPPASTGGSAITGYTVVASPGGATASGATSPLVVAGLSNGTSYTFTVSATNALGSGPASPASGAVTPATVPGAPAAPFAVAGNTQATVNFTPPASNGGSAITGYTVVASPGGATVSGLASPLVVPGLSNGTGYSFTVRATNALGSGPSSPASNLITPATVPAAPAAPAAVAGNAQATVSFAPPASNGGSAITGYTVVASPGGATAIGTASPLVVAGLSNGTSYTFTVSAANAVGSGPASPASGAVTPATVPSAPAAPTAVAGNAQATVSFTPPASNGGSAITGYTVVASPGGATVSGAASPLVVPGLSNGIAYTFTVRAANALGTGPASTASAPAIPFTVPDAPPKPVAVGNGATGEFTISFSPPAFDGGRPITGYTVTGVNTGTGAVFTGTGLASPIVIVVPDSPDLYIFTVTATNAAGTSAASPPSDPTQLALAPSPTRLAGAIAPGRPLVASASVRR